MSLINCIGSINVKLQVIGIIPFCYVAKLISCTIYISRERGIVKVPEIWLLLEAVKAYLDDEYYEGPHTPYLVDFGALLAAEFASVRTSAGLRREVHLGILVSPIFSHMEFDLLPSALGSRRCFVDLDFLETSASWWRDSPSTNSKAETPATSTFSFLLLSLQISSRWLMYNSFFHLLNWLIVVVGADKLADLPVQHLRCHLEDLPFPRHHFWFFIRWSSLLRSSLRRPWPSTRGSCTWPARRTTWCWEHFFAQLAGFGSFVSPLHLLLPLLLHLPPLLSHHLRM